MSNDRAEVWLRERGLLPVPEPDWVMGRKPDFFCAGPPPVWVEVKTFDPTDRDQRQGRAWMDLRSRIERLKGLTGDVYAASGQNYTEAHGKLAAHLIRQIARSPAPTDCDTKEVVFIPGDAVPDSQVTLKYLTEDALVVQIGPRSESGKYGFYGHYEPQDWGQNVEIIEAGVTKTPKGYDVFENRIQAPITAAYFRSDTALHLGSLSGGGGMVNTSDRLRGAIDEANDQIRSGQAHRPAPGLCVVYHDSLDATTGHMFLAALFGDLTIPIDRDPVRMGEAYLGRNAILTPQQNRGVSAVLYVTANYGEAIAVNPYAEFPIDGALFGDAPVWVLEGSQMVLLRRRSGQPPQK